MEAQESESGRKGRKRKPSGQAGRRRKEVAAEKRKKEGGRGRSGGAVGEAADLK